jgi:hypothetical protein
MKNPIGLVNQSLYADKERGNIEKFMFFELIAFTSELVHTLWLYLCQGEEIFVRYGYELDYCPEWYLEAWEKGKPNSIINTSHFKKLYLTLM